MGRRRNKRNPWRGVANARNVLVHLMPGQLPAFTGLSALRHLDLQLIGVDEILGRHAETRGGYLFNGATAAIAVWVRDVAHRVFPTLSGVAFSADTIHCNGEGFVCLTANGA